MQAPGDCAIRRFRGRITAVAPTRHTRMPTGVPPGRHADDRTKGTS